MKSLWSVLVVLACMVSGGCGDTYDPCENKSCGETCQLCPPGDAECSETGEVKACDRDGACLKRPVQCN